MTSHILNDMTNYFLFIILKGQNLKGQDLKIDPTNLQHYIHRPHA